MSEDMAVDNAPKPYQLSRELDKHEMDVRGVCCLPSGMLVTASRDDVVRVWPAFTNTTEETPQLELIGHSHFTYSVHAGPQGELTSGDGDGKIIRWDLGTGQPAQTLTGHNDAKTQYRAVTDLALSPEGYLISCSWDFKVRVWDGAECLQEYTGHSAAVWAVLCLPDGSIVTGSADKSIKLWKAGNCYKTVAGHTDAVRGLALLPALAMFVSVSNDGTLRCWQYNGEAASMTQAHEHFIYAVATNPKTNEIFTVGEDRTLKVWSPELVCRQSIPHPAIIWSVAVSSAGDVITGCSDHCARVWTREDERSASTALVQLYQGRIESATMSAKAIDGGVPADKIEGKDSLQLPPKAGQSQKFVREDSGAVGVYTWSAANASWQKIGDVVEPPQPQPGQGGGAGGAPMGLQQLGDDGQMYDHIYPVEVEGTPPMKLCYNQQDNPYAVAEKFVLKHNLGIHMMEQIVQFIMQNTPDVGTSGTNANPFTSAATGPMAAAGNNPFGAAPNAVSSQPLAQVGGSIGASAYGFSSILDQPLAQCGNQNQGAPQTVGVNSSSIPQAPQASQRKHFPKGDPVLFNTAANVFPKMESKILELAEKDPAELVLRETDRDHLHSLFSTLKNTSFYHTTTVSDYEVGTLLHGLLKWPRTSAFPYIDTARALLLHEGGASKFLSFERLEKVLALGAPDGLAPVNVGLTLKFCANLFGSTAGQQLIQTNKAAALLVLDFVIAAAKETKAATRLAAATVILNLGALYHRHPGFGGVWDAELNHKAIEALLLYMGDAEDHEVVYRAIVAAGTLAISKAEVFSAQDGVLVQRVLAHAGCSTSKVAELVGEIDNCAG